MSADAARWRDLGTRVVSAIVMIAITLVALQSGQVAWAILIFIVYALMIWELAPLCDPAISPVKRLALAPLPLLYPVLAFGAAAVSGENLLSPGLAGAPSQGLFNGGYLAALVGLLAPVLAGIAVLRAGHVLWVAYGAMLAAAALFLAFAFNEYGVPGLVVLVGVVVLSDTAGYFAGRMIGGPRLWPAVSPKKTWSGTLAGWVVAAVFGAYFLPRLGMPAMTGALVAVALSIAAQAGDIAESAMKRRVGVKDASNLIPGHGGVLDRMDGLVAAACLAGILALVYGV